MQSENTPETDAPGGDAGDGATLHNLRDLYENADTETPGGESSTDDKGEVGREAPKNAKPVKFNDLAGAMDLELDDLYALKVAYSDGKEMSIEELKDLGHKQDEIVLRELQWEEQRSEQEGKLRRTQAELMEIVQSLPKGALNDETLAKVREKQAGYEREQRALTLDNIPSWQDEKVRTAELKGMASHMEDFGFPKDALASVVDHRMMAFIRQSWLREQRIKAALSRVTPPKPDKSAGTRVVGQAPKQTASSVPKGDARNALEAFFSQSE